MSARRKIEEMFTRGDFAGAEISCRAALKNDPDSVPILQKLSLALENLGRIEEVAAIADRIHHLQPREPDGLFQLGRLFLRLEEHERKDGVIYKPFVFAFPWGRIPFPNRPGYLEPRRHKAMESLRQCLALAPGHHEARTLLGTTLTDQLETLPEAAVHLQKTLAVRPEILDAHFGIGRIAFIQGQLEISRKAFDNTLRLDPAHLLAGPYSKLTAAILSSGNISNALLNTPESVLTHMAETLRMFLAIGAGKSPHQQTIGQIAHVLSIIMAKAAESFFSTGAVIRSCYMLDSAARLTPNLPEASEVLGRILLDAGLYQPAQVAFKWALEAGLKSEYATEQEVIARVLATNETKGNIDLDGIAEPNLLAVGHSLRKHMELEKTEIVLKKLYAINPRDIDVGVALIEAISTQGKLDEALNIAQEFERVYPNDPLLQHELWNIHASLGHPEIAWPYFESRLRRQRFSTTKKAPPLPQWNGEDIGSKRLIVWPEEGIGDEMRFSSCLRDIHAKFGDRVVCEISPRLVTLLRRSLPGLKINPFSPDSADYSAYDLQIPIGSLALHFRRRISEFPKNGVYLKPDPRRVERWRKRLADFPKGPKIGISWRSLNMSWAKRHLHGALTDYEPVFNIPDATFINLQCETYAGEIAAGEKQFGVKIRSFEDLDVKNEFEEVAALLSVLDYVVAARCWIFAFAGAVGTKAYAFSVHPNPFMFGLDYDPWSPTSEVFYKAYGESWKKPIGEIAEAIQKDWKRKSGPNRAHRTSQKRHTSS